MPKLHGHGENSVTFSLFTECSRNWRILDRLIKDAKWSDAETSKSFLRLKQSDYEKSEIHLFPCFGKREGYGEPDVIILLPKKVIYIEVELARMDAGLPDCFSRQMNKFIELSCDIKNSKISRIVSTFTGETGGRFRGPARLRRLFQKMKEETRDSYFLVIGDSQKRNCSIQDLHLERRLPQDIRIGWMSLGRLMRMGNLSDTKAIIKQNRWS